MHASGISGITDIECPRCGTTLREFDAPEILHGITRLTARCRHCRTEQVLRIDRWRGETSVSGIDERPWAQPAS